MSAFSTFSFHMPQWLTPRLGGCLLRTGSWMMLGAPKKAVIRDMSSVPYSAVRSLTFAVLVPARVYNGVLFPGHPAGYHIHRRCQGQYRAVEFKFYLSHCTARLVENFIAFFIWYFVLVDPVGKCGWRVCRSFNIFKFLSTVLMCRIRNILTKGLKYGPAFFGVDWKAFRQDSLMPQDVYKRTDTFVLEGRWNVSKIIFGRPRSAT